MKLDNMKKDKDSIQRLLTENATMMETICATLQAKSMSHAQELTIDLLSKLKEKTEIQQGNERQILYLEDERNEAVRLLGVARTAKTRLEPDVEERYIIDQSESIPLHRVEAEDLKKLQRVRRISEKFGPRHKTRIPRVRRANQSGNRHAYRFHKIMVLLIIHVIVVHIVNLYSEGENVQL